MTLATITALPTAPSRSDDSDTFVSRADALLAALPGLVTEVNAWSAAVPLEVSAANFNTTSATSLLIGTGSKAFTAGTGKLLQIGQFVVVASAASPANYMTGQVTAYNSSTGALTVNVTAVGGSGTFADWVISLVPTTGTPTITAARLIGNPTGDVAPQLEISLAGGLAFSGSTLTAAGALTPTSIAATGALTSSSPTAGVGYATGAGGAVTQASSRTSGVTLNKRCGAITLVSAAGTGTVQSFTVTNSTIAATDTVVVCQKSGTDPYYVSVTNVAAGSFKVTYGVLGGGTTTEQPVFSFAAFTAAAV